MVKTAANAFLILSAFAVSAEGRPVTVMFLSPTNGGVVSGTVTLSVTAASTVAPIQRVKFYRDGVLIGTVYGAPPAPTNLHVVSRPKPVR